MSRSNERIKKRENLMTFEQIDYFITLVNSDTFFDAAEVHHISQSALSKQIIKLEKELNITLFDRSKRSATLTPAGKAFYEEALLLSGQYRKTLLRMQQFQRRASTALSLGTLPILTQYHLTSLLKDFSGQYPEIQLSVEEVEEQELMQGLFQERFDLIIARSHMVDLKNYSFHPLTEDRLCAILPVSHPLVGKNSVSIHELANENFFLMKPYTSIYQLCMQLFQEAKIQPRIIRTLRPESIISSIGLQEGISLLPEKSFHIFHHGQLAALPLREAPRLSVGIASKRSASLSPAARTFLHFTRKESCKAQFSSRVRSD